MAIKRYAGDKFTGLSSDTKPTNVPDGATFYELDTKKTYVRYSSTWTETASTTASAAFDTANAAYETANSVGGSGIAAAFSQANTAYSQANLVYGQANTAYSQGNIALGQANSAWDKANLAYTFAANAAHLVGNTAYNKANAANAIAEASFILANSTNVMTYAYSLIAAAALTLANSSNAVAYGGMLTANSAYDKANAVNIIAVAAFAQANTGGGSGPAYDKANAANIIATSAFGYANGVNSNTFTALATAIAAFAQANTGGGSGPAFDAANAAFIRANTANATANLALPLAGGSVTGRVNVAGFVGIGTTSAAANLDVFGQNATTVAQYRTPGSQLSWYMDTGYIQESFSAPTLIVTTNTSHALAFGAGNAERMRIAPSGNVGIGTITPTSNLHVIGTANITGDSIVYGRMNVNNHITAISTFSLYRPDQASYARFEYMQALNRLELTGGYIFDMNSGATGRFYAPKVEAGSWANVAGMNIVPTIVSSYDFANTIYTYAANNVMLAANAAFAMANAANLMPVGNTMANGYYTARATRRQINFVPGTNITINVVDDPTLNTANVTITASAGADPAAPLAYDKANAANIIAVSAFGYANGVNTNTFTSLATAIAAFGYANGVNTNTFTSLSTAIAAFGYANGVNTNTFTSLATAIAAYGSGNTTYTYAANNVMLAANAAFAMANAANLHPIGNTNFSNSYYTVRSTLRQINFIPGSVWDAINVNPDVTLNTANVIITTNLTGAFTQANIALGQANSAWDKANLAYTFAANDAHRTANAAFAYANGVNTNTFTSLATAIASFGYANGVNTNTFSSIAIATAAYAAGNTNWTYAANNVMLAANSAFAMANAANLMPVGNTMANGYYSVRATRRQINLIPGTNITINVDDNPTLNTANVTIASSASGGDPSEAFNRANTANLQPVGNTMANGYFTTRSTKNKINFVPGTNITIEVNDDAALNTANIIINASVPGGGDPADAFHRANTANLRPVGNTMSNGYYTVRSTRNQLNLISGTNITINVDDDPTLNTSNVTIAATGGGSVVINTAEIDFGSSPAYEKRFTIVEANATVSSIVLATHSLAAATGKAQDENEADTLILSAFANNGNVIVYARAIPGPVIGKFKINYYLG